MKDKRKNRYLLIFAALAAFALIGWGTAAITGGIWNNESNTKNISSNKQNQIVANQLANYIKNPIIINASNITSNEALLSNNTTFVDDLILNVIKQDLNNSYIKVNNTILNSKELLNNISIILPSKVTYANYLKGELSDVVLTYGSNNNKVNIIPLNASSYTVQGFEIPNTSNIHDLNKNIANILSSYITNPIQIIDNITPTQALISSEQQKTISLIKQKINSDLISNSIVVNNVVYSSQTLINNINVILPTTISIKDQTLGVLNNVTLTYGNNNNKVIIPTKSGSNYYEVIGFLTNNNSNTEQYNKYIPIISASANSVLLGENALLSLDSNNYWANNDFSSTSSGYVFKYQWVSTNSNKILASGILNNNLKELPLTYSLTSLTITSSYYLMINVLKNNILQYSIKSNVVQILVINPIITIGIKDGSGFNTSSTIINQQNMINLTFIPSKENANWYENKLYQWLSYDEITNQWDAVSSNWQTITSNTIPNINVKQGTYKLVINVDNVFIYSNAFTVTLNQNPRSIILQDSKIPIYGQDVTINANNNGFNSSNWTFIWKIMDNKTKSYVNLNEVLNSNEYHETINNNTETLTIYNCISSYVIELVATNSNNNIDEVTSNSIAISYNNATLSITNANISNDNTYDYGQSISELSINENDSTWKSPYNINPSDLIYTWYENNQIVSNNITYLPKNLQVGTYQYYLVITCKTLSNYKVVSNTITIHINQPVITISSSNSSTNQINFGKKTNLTSSITNINSNELGKSIKYQWQYLNNSSWMNAPDITNYEASSSTNSNYSFIITKSNTYRLVLLNNNNIIATSNILNLECINPPLVLTAQANNIVSNSFINGSNVTISLSNNNVYENTIASNWTYTWIDPNGNKITSSTIYSGINTSNLSFVLNSTTTGLYYLVISNSLIDFSLKSTAIAILINDSSINLTAQAKNKNNQIIQWFNNDWTSNDAVEFGSNVLITAIGENVDLSNGNYSYIWQYYNEQSNNWVDYDKTSNSSTLNISAVKSSQFRVIVKSASNSWISKSIKIDIIAPTIIVTATSNSNWNCFSYACYVTLTSVINNCIANGSWNYTWIQNGNYSSPLSTSATTGVLLVNTITIIVIYTYVPTKANINNSYYQDVTFSSNPLIIQINNTRNSGTTISSSSSNNNDSSSNSSGVSVSVDSKMIEK